MKDLLEKKKIIASRLAMARKRAGLSQEQVATELKLPRPSISEIESGRRRVAVDEMLQFADLYKVEMDWLSGQGAEKVNAIRDDLLLAARGAKNLKSEDLDEIIDLLTSMKKRVKNNELEGEATSCDNCCERGRTCTLLSSAFQNCTSRCH